MKCCKKCGSTKQVEEHHIHCKFMDNSKGYGLKVNLCKKCHTILGLIIPSILWKYIPEKDKFKVIKEVENFTINFYCKNLKIKHFDKQDKEKYCGNYNCCYELDEEDIINGICPYCLRSIIKEDCDYEHY